MWKFLRQVSVETQKHQKALNQKLKHLSTAALSERKLPSHSFEEGAEVEGFLVKNVTPIPEFQMTAIKLQHIKTLAEYFHLNRDDSNNVFAVAFRTPPPDSTGMTHILEHLSLCGSDKYPVRDPFMKMLTRSMATFMNAMTGPDYTFYPFSSQNHSDYFNLMSIYLDAVFKPQLKQLDFMQEGWRLEHEDVNDKTTPIIFKGVVFNEMKGCISDNSYIFGEALMNNILPTNCYKYVSGGDPIEILNLKYDNLVNYHKKHYHPTNSKFFSYGNFNLEDHLSFINSNYLSKTKPYEHQRSSTIVVPEKTWDKQCQLHVDGRHDPLASENQSHIAISHKCANMQNFEEVFVLNILGELLLKGPNAPFYKNLIETGLGLSFSPVTGYESSIQDTLFTIGLQGVNSKKFDEIIATVNKTLDEVIADGFEDKQVESVLHSLELSLKHQSSNFGLNLLFWLVPFMNHDCDVISLLHINDRLNWFKKHIKENPKYLQQKVDEYLRSNPHRLVITMSPEKTFDEKLEQIEKNILKERISKMNEQELDKVYGNGIELRKEQEKPPNADVLPTLKISDVDDKIKRVVTTDKNIIQVPTQLSVQPTNGVTYFRAVVDTSELSPELKPLVPLFNYVINQMRTTNYDFREMDQLIHMSTGGISFNSHLGESCTTPNAYEEALLVSTHSLEQNNEKMFEVLSELFNNVQLTDINRFTTLVNTLSSELINGISGSGHRYAMSIASSLVDPVSKQKEIYGGLSFVSKIKNIAQSSELEDILRDIQTIGQHVLNKNRMRCALNISAESTAPDHLESFLKSVSGEFKSQPGQTTHIFNVSGIQKVSHVLPFPVNFTAKSVRGVPFLHKDYVALKVLTKFLTTKYLLREVREKNGAYGAGAVVSPSGVIQFYSYRDPYALETLATFDQSSQFLSDTKLSSQDLDEAKLGVFQEVDAPTPPGSKGMGKFLYGKTDDMVEQYRLNVKQVTEEDIRRVADTYLSADASEQLSSYVVIGPKTSNLGDDWTIVDHDQ
uniref:Presequence protease, mitochondrial n=1 Tax=Cacopsylla melanoneura TaxID=428564 RepID=A0A8D8PNA7_9HEMI